MKKLILILIFLFIGINLLQNSDIFYDKDVKMTFSQIKEHHNNQTLNSLSPTSIKNYILALNDKYETNFTKETFNQQIHPEHINDMQIQTNIYHYYLVFLLIKTIIAFLIGILLIKNSKNSKIHTALSCKDFLIISFLAIYQPAYIYVNNLTKIPFLYGIGAIAIIYLFFLMLYCVFSKEINNKVNALTSAIALSIICYNYYNILFYMHNIFNIIILCNIVLFLIPILDTKFIKTLTKIISFTLIALLLFNFISSLSQYIYNKHTNTKLSQEEYNIIKNSVDKNRDIYIIILDMYSGKDILSQKFNFDNHNFIENLKSQGFYVYDHMYSNYNYTFAAIPSFFNCNYLEKTNFKDSSLAINNSLLFQMAKHHEYNIYYLNSWYFALNNNFIDKFYSIKSSVIHETKVLFFEKSIFRRAITKTINTCAKNKEFKFISDTINTKGKKLVVFHVLAPHWPYLYDENGNAMPQNIYMNLDKGYLSYLKYTNKETLKLIDRINRSSEIEPMIIITGDHGLRDENILESHFSTFTAYYNPEQNYEQVKGIDTLINFFTEAINYEFSTKIDKKPENITDVYNVTNINDDKILKKIKAGKNVTNMLKYTKKGGK